MLNHSRPHIRKRAVLAMYKVVTKYPDVLPSSMGRLRDKLDDSDPGLFFSPYVNVFLAHDAPTGVVAATVNVLCELAPQSPRDYLPLAPQLFHLLTTSSNNWMLIKIIKLVRRAVFLPGSGLSNALSSSGLLHHTSPGW